MAAEGIDRSVAERMFEDPVLAAGALNRALALLDEAADCMALAEARASGAALDDVRSAAASVRSARGSVRSARTAAAFERDGEARRASRRASRWDGRDGELAMGDTAGYWGLVGAVRREAEALDAALAAEERVAALLRELEEIEALCRRVLACGWSPGRER